MLDIARCTTVSETEVSVMCLQVPATARVCFALPDNEAKLGSLQAFVTADTDMEDMGTSHLPVAEVHKVAILDIRIANADRNGGNLLAARDSAGEWRLTPIDHGYCMPDTFADMAFEWSAWPQARTPTTCLFCPGLGRPLCTALRPGRHGCAAALWW